MKSPFATIQQDVLGEIFDIVFTSERYYDASYSRAVWGHRERAVLVTHVCRYWRSVALDTPSLWNYIVIPAFSGEQVAEYLQRSGRMPLTLYIINWKGHPSGRMWYSLLPLLQDHFHRVKEWRTYSNYLADPRLSLSLGEAQNIEDLSIENKEIRPNDIYGEPVLHEFPEGLLSRRFPKLKKLSIAHLTPDPSLSWFQGLSYLSMHGVNITPQSLTNVLEQLNRLEFLRLSKMIMFTLPASAYENTKIIKLPFLKELRINLEHPANQTLIFDYLNILPLADVYISSLWRDPQVHEVLVPTRLPNIAGCQRLKFSALEQHVLIEVPRAANSDGNHMSWKIRSYHFLEYSTIFDLLFNELASISDPYLLAIKNLEFVFSGIRVPDPGEMGWSRLLWELRNLERLTFRVLGTTQSHASLHKNIAVVLRKASEYYTSYSKEELGCPNLNYIHLDGFMLGCIHLHSRSGNILDELIRMLSHRELHGHRLRELKITNAYSLTASSVNKLREKVETLTLDDASTLVELDDKEHAYEFDEKDKLIVQ